MEKRTLKIAAVGGALALMAVGIVFVAGELLQQSGFPAGCRIRDACEAANPPVAMPTNANHICAREATVRNIIYGCLTDIADEPECQPNYTNDCVGVRKQEMTSSCKKMNDMCDQCVACR